jgi:membrane associated rhomboid family serine protease
MTAIDKKNLFLPLKNVLIFVLLLWVILFIELIIPFIKELGIRPREFFGLIGIFTSPFIHDNIFHLIANTTGLIVLGTIFMYLAGKRAIYILLSIIILGGIGTWLIGRSGSNHIGASGIVYGLLGFLLLFGIFKKSAGTILISILVFLLYGGALWGVFPMVGGPAVSWEGHLCGFAAGTLVAWSESRMGRVSAG